MRSLYRISLGLVALCAAAIYSVQPAKAQFSGCGAGVFGGGTIGSLNAGGPVSISSEGSNAGVNAECGWKFGAIYIGAGVDYSWQFGNLEKIGLENDLTLYGKAGFVVANNVMLYGHAGKAWLATSGPDIDAWKLGAGLETKLSNTPLYLDVRYTYTIADEADLGLPSVVDVTGHSVRLGLNVKFGPGMFGGKGAMFVNEDHNSSTGCDPKIDKGCKR